MCVIVSYLFYFYLCLTVGAKRCHDLGHSGWFQLIPFYVFVMLFSSGDDEGNEYGEKNDGISMESLKKLGIIAVIAIVILGIIGISQSSSKVNLLQMKHMIILGRRSIMLTMWMFI